MLLDNVSIITPVQRCFSITGGEWYQASRRHYEAARSGDTGGGRRYRRFAMPGLVRGGEKSRTRRRAVRAFHGSDQIDKGDERT